MTTTATISVAFLLSEHLINLGKATRPGAKSSYTPETWPAFVGILPDDETAPDNALGFYDTAGVLDGRHMQAGDTIGHSGVMLRVRSLNYLDGWRKINQLFKDLDEVVRDKVSVDGEMYLIESVTKTTMPTFAGVSEVRKRTSFTLNLLVTASRVP